MIRRLLLLAVFALFALSATACPFEIAGPATNLDSLPQGLEVTFAVEPGEVAQREPFTVTLSVRNTTTEPITVTTAHGCLAVPHVIRDGERIPFKGSWWGCGAAITDHVFPAGETRTMTWSMRAELYAQHEGDVDGAPAPKGTYWVQAEFDSYVPGNPEKPSVVAPLRVR